MIILDTDHLNLLQTPDAENATLEARMLSSPDSDFMVTVISLEEQFKGWLAFINRPKATAGQVPAYSRLIALVRFFSAWRIAPFGEAAAAQFDQFRSQGIRIGTMDLKIASIAITQNALLLTSNSRDFEKVPGLRYDNWLV